VNGLGNEDITECLLDHLAKVCTSTPNSFVQGQHVKHDILVNLSTYISCNNNNNNIFCSNDIMKCTVDLKCGKAACDDLSPVSTTRVDGPS